MSLNLWYVKYIHKQVERWVRIESKAKHWIEYYTKRRKELLKKLSTDDFFRFSIDTGYMYPPDKKK